MLSAQCLLCKYYHGGLKCKAFPGGIPIDMFTGQFGHTEPYPDADNPQDNGIRFEPIKDTE